LVAERARTWCVGLAVQKALDRAEEFFGEFRPPQVRREFDTIPATWRDRLTLWHTPKDASAPLLHVACNLACLRGLWPRIGYAYAMLFPGREHLAERYPFRHFGWVVLAHAQRAVRGMARAIFMPFESLRRTTSLGGLKGAT